ncbi:hypothetical protein DH2020_044238 [Rehmannia glutinosa]|uniref:Protein kinase domain-containing protein n=1 Tax=Rehmannia glutinosa TaxID=99300 RepID=A0ABR0UIL7_REHGL
MKEFWRSTSRVLAALVISCFYLLNSNFCWSLNDEGVALLRFKEKVINDPHGALSNWRDEIGVENPCSWFGIECFEGYVVALNLKDLCLSGTLGPDMGDLVHVKSIILRNNSFSGVIPEKIVNLKELEVLDLGYNNFSGQIPCQLGNNFSMTILLLDNNELLGGRHPEIYELQKLSEVQVEDLLSSATRASSCNELVISRNSEETEHMSRRKLLQEPPFMRRPVFKFFPLPPPPEPVPINLPPPATSSSPSAPTPAPAPAQAPAPSLTPAPSIEPLAPSPSPSPITPISPSSLLTPAEGPRAATEHSRRSRHRLLIVSAATGGPLLLLLLIGIFFWQSGKVSTVKPWATGLSGQLQRAFVTGVPKLKRSELEAACEDFSNVIGSSSLCTLYKGTLSSGVEIAVASIAVASAKDWSNSLETQFRKKIETLSKVNHKNFVSLLGYCVEEEPFTRVMVFEYAPNGTLFEHLHIREAEHLDWPMRMRIAMGMAYCLEHMHQLIPTLPHRNLNSSAVYLTEDYAAKISDFIFSNEVSTAENEPNVQNNVYSFGVVLFEMITGRLPYSAGSDSVEDWASEYLSRAQNLREMVDPTLETYQEDQLGQIGGVIKLCVNPDPRLRPSMYEVCVRMREITGIEPDGAIPKVSPLWWAELEIMSTEAS